MHRYEWKAYIVVETDDGVETARNLMESTLWSINKNTDGVRVYKEDGDVFEQEEVD